MWSVKPYISLNTLKMIYYSYFHSVTTCGLLFWGHSSKRLKKKIIRIMMGFEIATLVENCFFFNLEILPLPSQYIFSLLLFMTRNRNQFLASSEVYHTDTRQHVIFHQCSVNFTKYQKGVYCLGV